ncbi:MAG: glycosyltransferase, partial [Rhizobiales bacterium]|nr:glycosyltransferase [Hyphomicrobiales bacterium]
MKAILQLQRRGIKSGASRDGSLPQTPMCAKPRAAAKRCVVWVEKRFGEPRVSRGGMSVREEGRLKSLVEMASGLLTNAGGVSGAFSRIWLAWRNDGWSGLRRLLRRIVSMFSGSADAAQITSRTAYHAWISQNDTLDDAARARIRSHIGAMPRKPLISVAMPVYNPEPQHLDEAIQSVRDQLYPYWELCIADDASTDPAVRKTIDRHVREDRRIKVAYRETNGHICR